MITPVATFFSAAIVSLFMTFPVIWTLSFFKLGQPVREEGPVSHQAKSGTLTMGGIGFILAIVIITIITIDFDLNPKFMALLLLFLAYAGIGLADDILKIRRGKNLGLTFWQKIFSQVIIAEAFAVFLGFDLFSQLFVGFVVIGSANATNLTDGLNGLLAGTAGIAFMAFAVLAGRCQSAEAVTFSLVAAGAIFAFLFFNFPQAKVFMGDVGSLAIGAGLAGVAILLHQEMRLAVIGGVFVAEALSVIIQVGWYKLFRKRVFKMAPLHHHFELMGISERHVVIGFWLAGGVLGLLGALL